MANLYKSVLASGGGVQPTGDAVEANVLAGKTFSNASGIGKTGTMVNNGAVSETISGGQSYNIPEGYHNGSGVVNATRNQPSFNPSFAVTGSSGTTLGTNFEAGHSYAVFTSLGNSVNVNISSGGTLIRHYEMMIAANAYAEVIMFTASDSTVVANTSLPYIAAICEIY